MGGGSHLSIISHFYAKCSIVSRSSPDSSHCFFSSSSQYLLIFSSFPHLILAIICTFFPLPLFPFFMYLGMPNTLRFLYLSPYPAANIFSFFSCSCISLSCSVSTLSILTPSSLSLSASCPACPHLLK